MNFKTGDVISIYSKLYRISGKTDGGSVRLKEWLERDGEIHGMDRLKFDYSEMIHNQELERQQIERDERCRDAHIHWEYSILSGNKKQVLCPI